MGQSACKCECDKGENDSAALNSGASTSAFAEQVEVKNPTLGGDTRAAVAPKADAKADSSGANSAPSAFQVEQRPPEQAGAEPEMSALKAPKGKDAKQEKGVTSTQGASAKGDGLKTLSFTLEPKQNLGARFAELREPEPDGTLVATSIADRSALSVTTAGYPGILPGDIIMQVNGESGGRSRLLELLTQAKGSGGKLDVTVRPRPQTFDVELLRDGDEKMGIVVAVHDDIPDRVEVRQVSDDGAVPAWNEKNWMNQVVSGDWVMAVNGSSKAANDIISDMQSAWQKKQKLKMQILSYPTEEMRQRPASTQN